jgi:casein kinase I family protein HRR25
MILNEQVSLKGEVHRGTDIIFNKEVAIKMQRTDTVYSSLAHEFHVYKALAGGTGIPATHWFGIECGHNAMVVDLLGPSLQELFEACERRFSLKTVLLLVDQLVREFLFLASTFIQIAINPLDPTDRGHARS